MIGASVALTAAHCWWDEGAEHDPTGVVVVMGDNNTVAGNSLAYEQTPFGTLSWAYIGIPYEWTITAGSTAGHGTPEAHSGEDYDYALVEFDGSSYPYPGVDTGWYSFSNAYDGPSYTQYTMGYPDDHVNMSGGGRDSQWGEYIGPYKGHWGARLVHYGDVTPGDSGACVRTYVGGAWYCTGIVIAEWPSLDDTGWEYSNTYWMWNESKAWDSTVYNFFHANAVSWP
jgi:hypothetical protein